MQSEPVVLPRRQWSPRIQALVLAGAMLSLIVCLRCFPPQTYAFYPRCPVREFLGLLCPGCGGTRAVAAILAGQWSLAIRANVLIAALCPLAVIYATVEAYSAIRWDKWYAFRLPPSAVKLLWVTVTLFAITRNLTIPAP